MSLVNVGRMHYPRDGRARDDDRVIIIDLDGRKREILRGNMDPSIDWIDQRTVGDTCDRFGAVLLRSEPPCDHDGHNILGMNDQMVQCANCQAWYPIRPAQEGS